MPVGTCEAAFGAAAANDGLILERGSIPDLSDAGHLDFDPILPSRAVLAAIFDDLGGGEVDLRTGSHRPLPLDWVFPEGQLIVEVDEAQHFTSDRLQTLCRYPADANVAFSIAEYRVLCHALSSTSDRYRIAKEARGFRRAGGRRAQRAYFDAVRDLAAPDFGWRVFRVPAGHGNGEKAYREVRERLWSSL